jgi:methionine-rich copper-binding protein CopC
MTRRRLLVLVAGAAVSGPGAARAHAALVRSSPPRRATLAEPPARVELVFSERLEPAYSRLAVEDASGTRVDLGDAGVAHDDQRRLIVSLRPLTAGTYTVRFRVLSIDGHVVESMFPFTVTPPRGATR